MTKPLPEGFPSAEEIVSQYIKLRDLKDARKKRFEKEGPTETDQELLADLRAAWHEIMTTPGGHQVWADLIASAMRRLEELLQPLCVITEAMEALEGAANLLLLSTGQKALSTNAGTAFRKTVLSPKNKDPEAFITFILEDIRRVRDAMTAHVKKEFVETWMEEHEGNPPPGIEIDKVRRIEFRKA